MNHIFDHFVFASPLWFLLLIPWVILLFWRGNPSAIGSLRFPSTSVLGSLCPRPQNAPKYFLPNLLHIALFLCIIALARPQWQDRQNSKKTSGVEIVIALDISYSMSITDLASSENASSRKLRRIDAAKTVIESFIQQRRNDRIGLVVFAGRPYSVSPITLDHEWLISNLRRIFLGNISEEGTAIGSAIAAASTRLIEQKDTKSRIVILVTDGASNSGKLTPLEAAKHAAKLGIKVYTIAVGTSEGRLSGNRYSHFPQQEFDTKPLEKIAELTKAEYYRATDNSSLKNTFQSIDKLEKSKARHYSTVEARELYPWLVGIALLLSLLHLTILALNPRPGS